jgi:hypothetical protein
LNIFSANLTLLFLIEESPAFIESNQSLQQKKRKERDQRNRWKHQQPGLNQRPPKLEHHSPHRSKEETKTLTRPHSRELQNTSKNSFNLHVSRALPENHQPRLHSSKPVIQEPSIALLQKDTPFLSKREDFIDNLIRRP